jgi:hypothetical protein
MIFGLRPRTHGQVTNQGQVTVIARLKYWLIGYSTWRCHPAAEAKFGPEKLNIKL